MFPCCGKPSTTQAPQTQLKVATAAHTDPTLFAQLLQQMREWHQH